MKCETPTQATRKRIVAAGRKFYPGASLVDAVFEHGQWWVQVDDGLGFYNFSVCDAEGPGTFDGFSFEEV